MISIFIKGKKLVNQVRKTTLNHIDVRIDKDLCQYLFRSI